jgi:hypothetical protein
MGSVTNPYAAPAARVEDVAANPEAEAIRQAHINHEASIKAVGILYYLGGVVATINGLASLVGATGSYEVGYAIPFVLAGVLGLFAGYGVRALRPWGRIIGCILSGLGLLAIGLGTIINAYILYLFLSKKGRTIFSPGYKDVIAATPHVKYRTSIVIWILLGVIVAVAAAAFIAPMFR